MIKINIKLPSKTDLVRAAMAEVEKHVSQTARRASALHGGVKVRITRKPDGSLQAVEFKGSEAAIAAARTAVGR